MPNTCRTPLTSSDLTRASPPVILAKERMHPIVDELTSPLLTHQELQGRQNGQPGIFCLLGRVGAVDLVDLQADRAPARGPPEQPGQVHGRIVRPGSQQVGQPFVALDVHDAADQLDPVGEPEFDRIAGNPGRVRLQAVQVRGGLARVGQRRPDQPGIRADVSGEDMRDARDAARRPAGPGIPPGLPITPYWHVNGRM